ncbi:MAG TPA: methyltransferase domain-containing protein [Candidatus Eisenbacteria bacterium]|nr:methyltransferase domain-containing protein [Candidatus Eisenbacteria bacterium]
MNDVRDLSRRRFGAHAERYVSSPDHQTGESLDRLVALAAPRPDWRALDIATGGGHTALALAPLVQEVVASDLTPDMLAAAERFIRGKGVTNVSFREADACALPFADGEFDLVACRVAPHHFPDAALFVRECARVVKPGGTVVVIDNVVPDDPAAAAHINAIEKTRDPSHLRAYGEAEWVEFFRDAGLRVERVERFRKKRDFDFWTGMQSVDEPTKARLRAMFLDSPPGARTALAPEEHEGRLTFYLDEVLVISVKAPRASRP